MAVYKTSRLLQKTLVQSPLQLSRTPLSGGPAPSSGLWQQQQHEECAEFIHVGKIRISIKKFLKHV